MRYENSDCQGSVQNLFMGGKLKYCIYVISYIIIHLWYLKMYVFNWNDCVCPDTCYRHVTFMYRVVIPQTRRRRPWRWAWPTCSATTAPPRSRGRRRPRPRRPHPSGSTPPVSHSLTRTPPNGLCSPGRYAPTALRDRDARTQHETNNIVRLLLLVWCRKEQKKPFEIWKN